MKKQILFWVAAAAILLAAACGGNGAENTPAAGGDQPAGSDERINLEFWYSLGGDSGKAVEEMVKQFNASQAGITVTPIYQGDYAAIMAKVYSAISSGDLPQVAHVGAAPILGASGGILPMTDFTSGENGMDLSLIRPAFIEYNSSGGTMWSMPFNNSVPVLYYNRDLFKAAGLDPDKFPETFEEMIAAAGKLTGEAAPGGTPSQYGLNTADGTHWFLSTMMLGNGAQIVNAEETEALYNSPAAVEMLALWGEMVNTHKIMPPNQHEEAQTDFLAGKLAIYIASSSQIKTVKNSAGFDLGVAMFPQIGDKPRAIPIGGGSLVIFKNDSEAIRNASWAFVKFMASKDNSIYLSSNSGYLPIYKDALEWPEIQALISSEPYRKAAIESITHSVSIPVFSAIGNSDLALRQAVEKVELGAATPQQALDEAVISTNRAIKDLAGQG